MVNQDKSKRKAQSSQQSPMLRLLGKGLVALLSMAILFMGCGIFGLWWMFNDNSICYSTPFPNESHFAQQAQLTLPPSAQNIENGILYTRTDSCRAWLTFDMSPDDFEQFVSLIEAFEKDLLTGTGIDYFREQDTWEQPTTYLGGSAYSQSYRTNGYVQQWMLIDMSDSDTWIVYIITSEFWM